MDRNATIIDLHELDRKDFVKYDIPVTVYLSILCSVGVIGNIHIMLLYFKRYTGSSYQIFILTLAGYDVIACGLCIPFEIIDIYKSYSFTDEGLCKFFRFLIHFTSAGSGMMLVMVAIERYRKLCVPFGRQIVGREIYFACALVLVLAFAVAVPSVSVYGIVVKDIPEYSLVKGRDCKALRSFKHGFIYMAFILILSTSMFIACAVMYSIIGKVLYLHFSKRKLQGKCSSLRSENTDSSAQTKQTLVDKNDRLQVDDSGSLNKKNTIESKSSNITDTAHSSIETSAPDGTNTLSHPSDQKSKTDNTMRITLMLLVATSISYLGYIPAIISEIVKAANATELSPASYKAMNILTRSFYLNNAVNPIVFFLMDKRLRKDARKMYKKIWRKMNLS